MGAHLVDPGSVLAERYVIEDLLAQDGESESWRARDRVLSRSVVLQMLPSKSPYSDPLLAAAKRAARVRDTRVLKVLDAIDDGALSYVVREWATGQSLDVVLSEGPLPARRAAWLIREVAGAMASAHQQGLPHRRLLPAAVVLTKSSGVKLIGLGTAGALQHGDATDDAELADTRDLGRLLYACLTARWPGDQNTALPIAPTEHGQLLRPRQVRAGVPRALDAVCDRVLSESSRYGDPITTVTELKDALGQILSDEGFVTASGVGLQSPATPSSPQRYEPPPAILPREADGLVHHTGEQAAYQEHNGSSVGRTLIWTAAVVLLLGAVLLAYLVGQRGTQASPDEPPASNATSSQSQTSAAGTLQRLPISQVTTLDPAAQGGSGDENPEEAPLAVDGDPQTAWETESYFGDPRLGGQKPGVGLILDLGRAEEVSQVKVTLQGDGTSLQLRAAPEDAAAPPATAGNAYTLLDGATDQGTNVTLAPQTSVSTRYLLVWLTSLPPDGANYRGRIAEIKVLG